LPAIWEKWDEFTKNAGKLKAAASDLAKSAAAKDDAGIPAKVKALGDVCNACHTPFRAEKKG
jgi:cytochrome c556